MCVVVVERVFFFLFFFIVSMYDLKGPCMKREDCPSRARAWPIGLGRVVAGSILSNQILRRLLRYVAKKERKHGGSGAEKVNTRITKLKERRRIQFFFVTGDLETMHMD